MIELERKKPEEQLRATLFLHSLEIGFDRWGVASA
jgi:hypothetical protein